MSLENTHRRYNPLTGEWILVSPNRTKRPWQGQVEKSSEETLPVHDPNCYLCPGNERAGGKLNLDYQDTFVFTNDFSALMPDGLSFDDNSNDLFQSQSVNGTCRVICFSPRHNMTIPEMEIDQIKKVVDLWIDQTEELGKKYLWVQVFENKGAIMGCSNPHPHGQIWASNRLPNEPFKEDSKQKEYFKSNRSPLLLDYLKEEEKKDERIVTANENWVVLVPFWATWPFETLLLPRRHVKRITELSEEEKKSLAEILKTHLTMYDNLFRISFPYTMGWHGAPFNDDADAHWQLHAHFYPPLLRSSTVKKFMVGYEMLSEAQRDITPEQAAIKLKSLPAVHFKTKI